MASKNKKKKKRKYAFWSGSVRTKTNPMKILWNDIMGDVHTRNPTNVSELKQFCKEKWKFFLNVVDLIQSLK